MRKWSRVRFPNTSVFPAFSDECLGADIPLRQRFKSSCVEEITRVYPHIVKLRIGADPNTFISHQNTSPKEPNILSQRFICLCRRIATPWNYRKMPDKGILSYNMRINKGTDLTENPNGFKECAISELHVAEGGSHLSKMMNSNTQHRGPCFGEMAEAQAIDWVCARWLSVRQVSKDTMKLCGYTLEGEYMTKMSP